MGYHFASAQLCQKVFWAIEGIHLDIDRSDLRECMGVGTSASGKAEGASELLGSQVDLGLRPPVEDLDDVDLTGDPLDCLFPEVAPVNVIRVLEVHQPSLGLDGVDRPFGGQPAG